jgi:[NiFe] hydrogenase diaphorase moiety large subunit
MSDKLEANVKKVCEAHGRDATRLMDIARAIQAEEGCVCDRTMDIIAQELGIPRVDVASLVSFYSFLSTTPRGKVIIRLSDDIIDRMHGYERIKQVFCEELGIQMGETTPDGLITLEHTACIGMSDQAPAAIINDVIVTELSTDRVREIVRELRTHMDPKKLVRKLGDGNNAHELVRSMVKNNIRQEGSVLFSPVNRGEAIRKALGMSPNEVIRAVKTSRLRGRGGAGFPCGMKWEFTRMAQGQRKFVICNADEGEPGTFKDRVLLTERADRIFAGMTIAGYAIGAEEGIVYLRGEYEYLRPFLEDCLQKRRDDGLLGHSICGKEDFNFDIRIQMGAGAYVCGEETALISSVEGLRGDPKNRPPFPAQKGYLGYPTVVNNCETLCCVTKILEEGPATFSEHGTDQSSGTKLLSVSGDCMRPGVYEVELGIPLHEVLEMVGATDAIAVQVGGPSGQMVGPEQYQRKICFDDLATGGSMMVFGPDRNILEVAHAFMEFFEDESCGYCTPCRVGNVLLREGLERIMDGRGEPGDLVEFEQLGKTMKACSRCGLGQTSANPVISSLKNFRPVYDQLVQDDPNGFRRSFDLKQSLREAEAISGRESVICHE